MVIFEVGSGPHLAGVGGEGTLVVRLAGFVVEVVGLVQRVVVVVVRVLVDGRSASAAEIMAAALADRGRAVVVGSSTLGKGFVQTVAVLPDGGEMFLTWSRVLAPGGWPLQGLGVLPQVCTSIGQDALDQQMAALLADPRSGPSARTRLRERYPVVLIDEFTGRMMVGRRLSDGLHQAIEAKEGVAIQPENVTLASVTFQNYFRLYDKLAGMTGTDPTTGNGEIPWVNRVVDTVREQVGLEHGVALPVWHELRTGGHASLDELAEKVGSGSVRFTVPEGTEGVGTLVTPADLVAPPEPLRPAPRAAEPGEPAAVASPTAAVDVSAESLDVRWFPVGALPDAVPPGFALRLATVRARATGEERRAG